MSYLSIKAVSNIVGINSHTLRAWERRYSAVEPRRSPSGQRTYSFKDVEKLKLLKELTDHGIAIGQIAHLPSEDLELLKQNRNFDQKPQGFLSPGRVNDPQMIQSEEVPEIVSRIVDCIYSFDIYQINRILLKTRNRMAARDFVLEIVTPIVREANYRVLRGKLSVAKEATLNAILRNHVSNLIHSVGIDQQLEQENAVALTTIEGDLIDFEILLAQALCVNYDLVNYYFGPNLPVHALSEAVEQLKIKYLILGCNEQNYFLTETDIQEYLEKLTKDLPSECMVFIGGRSIGQVELNKYGSNFKAIDSLYQLDQIMTQIGKPKKFNVHG